MEHTWRWFGPRDPVDLERARQAGATGIVTALSEIPIGEVWPVSQIQERRRSIEQAGLSWSVVESLGVHPDIRLRTAGHARFVENYRRSLEHLASAGVRTVCYNFMPVLDWTRTDLGVLRPDGARTLSFDADRWAAFDLYLLERTGAEADYDREQRARARTLLDHMSQEQRDELVRAVIGGLPGANERGHDLSSLKAELARWDGVTSEFLFESLCAFLDQVLPTCERHDIRLCIHPDDPPRSLLGLPRILSSAADCRRLFERVPSELNGLTLCAGSFAAGPGNKPHQIAAEFAARIHFAHLRSVTLSEDGRSFSEADHLGGDVQLVELLRVLVSEERRRRRAGQPRWLIPMRPDHGLALTGDIQSLPGYSWLGRLKGLAELRGALFAIEALTE